MNADDHGYRFLCIRALRCNLTHDTHDTHAHACQRANDEARREFYADLLDDEVADLVERRSLRVTFSTALDRAGLVWVDRIVR